MKVMWNPWHGCHKVSEGCQNCYMFAFDNERGVDSNFVKKTRDFSLPLKKTRIGGYKIESGSHVNVCLTSDFFIEEGDAWRNEAWKMIKFRKDLTFSLFTKRVERISKSLPSDWGEGYDNVSINLTCENQRRIDERLPIFLGIPCKNRIVLVSPMLERVDMRKFLKEGGISAVYCAGENYKNARPIHFEWVEDLYNQCREGCVNFDFFDTGENFYKAGRHYFIPHRLGREQALRSGLHYLN